MRYLLIDHITEFQSGSLIRGVKNIAMSEDFLSFHFPDNPVMPGSLLLEALVQLAGWLEAEASRFNEWILLRKLRKCRYYGFARPGDQVMLELMPLAPANSDVIMYRGIGRTHGKKLIDVAFEGTVQSLSRLYDPVSAEHHFHILRRVCGFTPNG